MKRKSLVSRGQVANIHIPGDSKLSLLSGSEDMAGRFRTAFRDTFRLFHSLTQEVLGAFFLALAILFGTEAARQYQMYARGQPSAIYWVILALSFTVLMLGFGLQSFYKARRMRK